jgi:hypothetical protein
MTVYTCFSLKWESTIRHPLFEESLIFRLLICVYIFAFLCFLFIAGQFFDRFCYRLLQDDTNPLNLFLFSTIPLLLLDFVLKFFFKKADIQFLTMRRFPNSTKSIRFYFVVKELINFWNYYLLIFFFSFLTTNVYQYSGLPITIGAFVALYFSQLLISQCINHLKRISSSVSAPFLLNDSSLSLLSKSNLWNYISLTIKMIVRSPRMRQYFFSFLFLSVAFIYLISKQVVEFPFPIRLVYLLFYFTAFPMLFNQALFSAEAAFFDHLMMTPNFQKMLLAKYVICLFFSIVSFFVLLFVIPIDWKFFIGLLAMLFYAMGTVTLFSFSSILFVSTKLDLFGSYSKMLKNPPSVQSFYVFVTFALSIALVILISHIFSPQVAVWFMFITGVVSILFSNPWFSYLYRCFRPNKYEKMEIFRIQ